MREETNMSKEIFGELWEQVQGIVKERGLNLILDNKEKPEYIPKSRFDEVIGSKNELKSQVTELSSQFEALKKSAVGNETLTKQIEDLQKQNGDWEGKYKQTLLESSVKLKAVTEKAKDANDLVKFLDLSKLEVAEDGTVKGLDEQIAKLKETKAYLFDLGTTPSGSGANPAGAGAHKTEEQQLSDAYTEAIKAGNMPLAIALKNKLVALSNKK